MTIIALFALLLTIFSLLLVQFFDSFHVDRQAQQLEDLSNRVSTTINGVGEQELLIVLAGQMASTYRTGLVVVKENMEPISAVQPESDLPKVPIEQLLEQISPQLQMVFQGQEQEPKRIVVSGMNNNPQERIQILAVADPLTIDGETHALLMYQLIQEFDGTVGEVRILIYVVGVLAFIATTVFAFFLSTRITLPLREMKQTAHRIAEGDFHAEIPIISNDEIGELASSFNTMASKLNESVKALSHEKEQLSRVLRSMVDGVMMINTEGKIVVTNPPADHFLRDWSFERPNAAAAFG